MGEQVNALTYLGIPMIVIACALALLFMLNVLGSIFDFYGKVWPKIINFRRRRREKKEEKEKQAKLLERLAEKLESFEKHYSPDNIAKRNDWMQWVNDRAEVYDASVKELTTFKDTLEVTKELTLDLYINVNRHRIIDFAGKVVNENSAVSREEFNRIFKVYDEYEAILEKYGKTNGEVEISIRIIREAYESHMRNHTFIEDSRGY
jgi:hypothetical protein